MARKGRQLEQERKNYCKGLATPTIKNPKVAKHKEKEDKTREIHKTQRNEVEIQKNLTRKFSDVDILSHGKLMTHLGSHVTIFSQVPAQTLAEFRVNSLQGGARVSLFLFRAVAIGVSKYKYAIRRALLK